MNAAHLHARITLPVLMKLTDTNANVQWVIQDLCVNQVNVKIYWCIL